MLNYMGVLQKTSDPKKASHIRAIAATNKKSLFEARDKLIKGLAVARIKAKEEKEKERVERWEKVVLAHKKRDETT